MQPRAVFLRFCSRTKPNRQSDPRKVILKRSMNKIWIVLGVGLFFSAVACSGKAKPVALEEPLYDRPLTSQSQPLVPVFDADHAKALSSSLSSFMSAQKACQSASSEKFATLLEVMKHDLADIEILAPNPQRESFQTALVDWLSIQFEKTAARGARSSLPELTPHEIESTERLKAECKASGVDFVRLVSEGVYSPLS